MNVLHLMLLDAGGGDAEASAAVEHAEVCGATQARLLHKVFGDFGSGARLLICEFTSRSDLVRYAERPLGLVASIRHVIVASQLPIEGGESEIRGSVLELDIAQVNPGRWRDAMSAAQNGLIFFLAAGALNCRLWHLDIAGSYSRTIAWLVEYEDLAAWGERRDAAVRDPKVLEGAKLMHDVSPPAERISTDVFREIDFVR
ncbi:MAG: hypothetical protein ABW328_05030 [Ilumatobacteraceae bacterium]